MFFFLKGYNLHKKFVTTFAINILFVDYLSIRRCAKIEKRLTKYLDSKNKKNKINVLDIA